MRIGRTALLAVLFAATAGAENLSFRHLAGPTTGGGYVDGLEARFSQPRHVAVDRAGNIYVADSGNCAIRKVAPNGAVSTLAGNGREGFADGVGSAARFRHPSGLALAPDGSLIVADTDNGSIRRVTMDGEVTTIAGRIRGHADGSLAEARFEVPRAVAVDSDGTIYVGDESAVRKVDVNGVTTIAGRVEELGDVDGIGPEARFSDIEDVAIGPDRRLYVADTNNSKVRRVTLDGTVTTLVSQIFVVALGFDRAGRMWAVGGRVWQIGVSGSLTPLPSISSYSTSPIFTSIAFDGAGNAILADGNGVVIHRLLPNGVLTLVAGSPVRSGASDGDAASALFLNPFAAAETADGRILIGTSSGVREIAPSGLVSSLGYGSNPVGLTVDPNGNVYWSTSTVVWKRSPSGVSTSLAGVEGERGFADGRGSGARFGYAYGVAADAHGTVYTADTFNHRVRRIDADGNVTTYAGTGIAGSRDGARGVAEFQNPIDVVLDPAGNVYVLQLGSRIRRIGTDGMVTTLACRGPFAPTCSANALRLTRDVDGLFYAPGQNNVIYRITPAGDVEAVAGLSGAPGNVDGVGEEARFFEPVGVVVTADGRLVVVDSFNHCVRMASLPPVIDRFVAERAPGGARLTWAAHYAAAAKIDGVGAVAVSGSQVVAGSGPFTLTVTSGGGSATAIAALPRRRIASH